MTHIYALVDPRTSECRYIGKADNPYKRLAGHLTPSHRKHNWPRITWINKLLSLGLAPEMVVLEQVPKTDWIDAERWWISYMKSLGARLTNTTIGGDGIVIYGRKLSESHRQRLSELNRGERHPQFGKQRSAETRHKISLLSKGRPVSVAERKQRSERMTGERNWQYGKPVPAEIRAKISKTLTGRPMAEETKAKIAKANSVMTDELRARKRRAGQSASSESKSEAAKKGWITRKRNKVLDTPSQR